MESQETNGKSQYGIEENSNSKKISTNIIEENPDSKEKDKDIYFIILNPSEEKLNFKDMKFVAGISPSIVFNKIIDKGNGSQLEVLIFKFKRKKKKKEDKENKAKGEREYIIKFMSGDYVYIISFDAKKKSFIYSPDLKKRNSYLDNIPDEPLEQNIIPLYKKLDIFLEALDKNDENKNKEKLFEDSINLYEKKKKFSLLITLFLKIYDKNKDLCKKLIEIFYKINEEENTDKEKDLKKDLNDFNGIYLKAQEIIEENKYNPIYFYGILFCYFHYYDQKNFPTKIKNFSEGNADILFEILIQYYSHFMYPLNQNKEFYNSFIKYALKKDKNLEIFNRVLKYIEDIEAYLFVTNDNKKEIFEKYDKLKSDPIKLGPNLKLIKYTHDKTKNLTEKKENSDNESEDFEYDNTEELDRLQAIENECDNIIKLVEGIMIFSEKENILGIYLKTTFWINIIKEYDISDWENINNLHKLRVLFKKYNKLINFLYEENIEEGKKNKNKKKDDIKSEINSYYERDEFALILNKNIKEFFEKDKDRITNAEILGTVEKFNPYFSIRDEADKERYKNKRETYIFDYINFSKITTLFIKAFHDLNFEKMFEENISDYINKITTKIKDIQTFGNVFKLIEVERIKEEKQRDYFRILKEKYKNIIEKEIILIKGEDEMNKAIKIIAEFVSKLALYEKNNIFINDKIKKLNDKIKSLIYIELITKYKGEEYQELKNYIYDIYLNNIERKKGRDDVIKLVKKLSVDEKKFFMYEKLLKKCEFTKEEFFSNHENYKIKTLCALKKELEEELNEDEKKGNNTKKEDIAKKEDNTRKEKYLDLNSLSENENESAKIIRNTLDNIRQDLDKGKIIKKDLEKFLNVKRITIQQNNEHNKIKESEEINTNSEKKEEKEIDKNKEEVEEKLGLISLVLSQYSPTVKYAEYKKKIVDINEKVDKLIFIKDSLMIFHKNKFINDIQKIKDIIKEIEESSIIEFRNEDRQKAIEVLESHNALCEEINKVKDFLLFKKIFENATGIDQLARFEDATKKLSVLRGKLDQNTSNIEIIFNDKDFKNVFKNIKEELGKKDESKSELFAKQMIEYFNINNKSVIKDLKMLINSKKYEIILKSIKYFFDNCLDKKLNLPKNINLSELSLDILKSTLIQLKNKDIYDYESTSPYYRVFTSIYEKKEAIDFLLKYINTKEIVLRNKLIENLVPTNRSISIKDIDDTIECLKHFKIFIKKNTLEIINYLKLLPEEKINQFESFSKKFGAIIELANKTGKDNFEEVYQIITDASLLFNLDNEDFCYTTIDKEKKIKQTNKIKSIEEMIKLKSKINLQPKKSKEEIKNKKEEKEKDPYEDKCDKLLFFKDIISNLEVIYDKINILRAKGFNIPIVINVEIKYPKVSYKLNDKEKKVNEINDYLFKIKNNYENELSTVLETKKYLRFLYGKLFRKIRQHQEGNFDIPEIKRYILNKASIDDKIKEAENINNIPLGEDYEKQHSDYTKQIFESMSQYLISLFQTNKLDFDKLYDNMKIKEDYKNIKGISIKKCENESIEKYILYLYEEYLEKLPIAQNILICSKETSTEELQSFLYRAILCEYNTLFVIEILQSFSNFQYNKMYGYIDNLLSIKLEKYKKDNEDKKNVDKEKSRIYLDSNIVFVYNDIDNEIENAFKNELGKYTKNPQIDENRSISIIKEDENEMGDLNVSNILKNSIGSIQENDLLKNIKVITSDVCGLGKSFKIKKMIKEKEKNYYHFPLGGKLTKNEIYQKIFVLFETIKKDAKEEAKKNLKKKEDKDKNNEEYSEFNNVAIHLDLIETKDISLVNEFLFSFLITKFYTNNENIIYIPNNMQIYIEVPNSFENYLTKLGILNAFNKENIIQGELNQNETYNVKMLPLELESDIRQKFKRLNGIEKNEEIEQFIKDNFNSIGIKEYSYHQIQTFIKLYLSQFDSFEGKGKLKFVDTQGKDITKEMIENFVNSTKYFTNGGFAKLIMEKKHIKGNFELCLDAYESDLIKANFDIPLLFIDKKANKITFEKFPEEENHGANKIYNKNVDIVYLIDATGSMGAEIKAAKENVIKIFNKLKKNYKDYNFRFGSVFYRDKIDVKEEKDEYFQLTDDMKELEKNIGTVKAYGGGDGPEDWVGGYEIALNNMKWRNGIQLIIHIADAGAHGTEFSEGDRHPEQGKLLPPKIEECVKRNINIIGFKISKYPKKSFDKISEIYNDYKLKNKDFGQFIEIYEFVRENDEAVSNNFNKLVMEAANQVINSSYKYLKRLKQILFLPNDLEKDIDDKKSLLSILDKDTDNYVITDDNYKKMLLLVYRIKANVPVIIMGETGCGKTSLIKKLSQILNNGELLVEIINIHPGITDNEITNIMRKMNEKANNEKYKNKELWVFFDEINTCLSLSLLTEIFMNRTFNGEKLEKNIRLIGACNPYRKRKESIERCGLTREYDEDDQLVYKVEQLPQSLLYYVFSFGSLKDEDEKKYIKSIIEKLFEKEEEKLLDLTTEAISKCHIFLRNSFGNDPSVVSLREISRFTKCVEFFQDYFFKKEDFLKKEEQKEYSLDDETKKLYKIKSIICSIYLCYYIRLTNEEKRGNFENKLQEILLQIANVYCPENNENQEGNLFSKIRYQKFSEEIRGKNFKQFSDLLKFEEEFLLEQIELDKGIGKNQLLKENLFLLFLAVVTKIPLIIVGKPGTGKSLSSQLIYNSMRGKYSKPKDGKASFFINYPKINQIYFQGSKSTTPEDIEELFKKADDLYKNYKHDKHSNDKVPIYMILFDELGLAEKAPTNPLKVIHSKLEYDGKTEGTCFIGISNYSLDAAKINRALSLSVPNLEDKLDQLKATAYSIVESISEDAYQDNLIFDLLSRTYCEYKKWLNFIKKLTVLKQYFNSKVKDKENFKKKSFGEIENDQEFIKLFKKDKIIKTEFHGNRDFYNIIKGVAIEGNKLSSISEQTQIVPIINNFIERNFGGISYDIDINFSLEFEDTKERMANLKNEILDGKWEKLGDNTNKKGRGRGRGGNKEKKDEKDEKEDIKVTSVFLFKKIFNEACILESKDNYSLTNYKIGKDDVAKYNLNKCINDNINDNNSRYLLLEISSNLAPLIFQNIKIQNSYRENIEIINGSPFSDDISNNDYKTKKVSEIQNWASQKDKLIILQNLDQIQAYLYDLYNMNYKIIDDQRFVRICLDNFSMQLTPVNDTFKIIVLVGNEFVNKTDMAFLNRLEKMQISFQELLDNEQKELINNIQGEIRLKGAIKKEKKKYNYDLHNY